MLLLFDYRLVFVPGIVLNRNYSNIDEAAGKYVDEDNRTMKKSTLGMASSFEEPFNDSNKEKVDQEDQRNL